MSRESELRLRVEKRDVLYIGGVAVVVMGKVSLYREWKSYVLYIGIFS